MGRGNSDIIYFLEQHEREIINCCKKGMSNNEVIELLKTKYNRDVAEITYRKFKAGLNLTKTEFLETLLDEIQVMKTSGATDANVRRWLEEEHEIEVSRSTFSRFKKKYHITDKEKDPRARDKDSLTNRTITQGQIIDNEVHTDNIDFTPIGDIVSTMCVIIQGHPEIDYVFSHKTPKLDVELDTAQMREVLGEGISLGEPEIIEWLAGYLSQQYE